MVFLNPDTDKVVVYDDFVQAALQALLVGQRFICDFGNDESPAQPCVVELITKEDEDNEA